MTISERIWTGKSKKPYRAAQVAATVEGYDASKDAGMDIADAICLAWWAARNLKGARG